MNIFHILNSHLCDVSKSRQMVMVASILFLFDSISYDHDVDTER